MTALQRRLLALPEARLQGIRRGVEKESLRALPGGGLAVAARRVAGSGSSRRSLWAGAGRLPVGAVRGRHGVLAEPGWIRG